MSGHLADVRAFAVLAVVTLLCACDQPKEPQPAAGDPMCFGPANGNNVVYLHGMDGASPSGQERENRTLLQALADSDGVRIVIPRAPHHCPAPHADQFCWLSEPNDASTKTAADVISRAASACFGSADASYRVLGFSNGGYFALDLYRRCQLQAALPHAGKVLVVGAGRPRLDDEREAKDLASCGRLDIWSGTNDADNGDRDDALVKHLNARHGVVTGLQYDGGHILPGTISQWLYIRPASR